MKKLKAASPLIEVDGRFVLLFLGSDKTDTRIKILKDNEIIDPKPGRWYSQQAFLNSLKELSASALKLIGEKTINELSFSPDIKTTKEAFEALNVAYKANHRGGFVGSYRLISYDESKKELVMECNTPYPNEFDEGLLEGLLVKFKLSNFKVLHKTDIIEDDGTLLSYTIKW